MVTATSPPTHPQAILLLLLSSVKFYYIQCTREIQEEQEKLAEGI